jgi:hypothetical protein
MMLDTTAAPLAKHQLLAGRALSGLAVLFLLFDATIKLLVIPPVVASFGELGYPARLAPAIGIVELICVLAYLVPRTALFGAVLLTGYLGGAVASNLRIGSPLLTHVLFPIYVAALVWGGLVLRDRWLRALV